MNATWDAHAHVIGDPTRFPLWSGRGYTPAAASLEDYLAMLDRHGLERGVLVQPSVYGSDNSCLLDALDRADGRLRGVAVPPPDATARDLEALHAHGVRAVRCNTIDPGGLSPDVVRRWLAALAALGWHVELQVAVDTVPDLGAFVAGFGVPVVIDHMGRPGPGRLDPSSPPLADVVALVRDGACFVKLSAPYRISRMAPPWEDVTPLARALVAANPAACLWGSDWPQVNIASAVGTGDLVDALATWCPDAGVRHVVMTEAAGRLFGP